LGKYFGREPRYSKEEAEAQAKQAIDAAVSRGRPPAEDWAALQGRMSEINQELATRPRIDLPPPPPRRAGRQPLGQVLRPPEPEPEPEAAPAPAPIARRPAAKTPVAKKPAAKKAAAKKAPAPAKAPTAKRTPAKKRST
jgi:hypothetical protein